MASAQEFQPTRFLLESLSDVSFSGFTDGSDWNGWACPFFPHDTAIRILETSQSKGYWWTYDAKTQTFVVNHRDDPADFPPERFEGVETIIGNEKIVLFPIGAYSWTWTVHD